MNNGSGDWWLYGEDDKYYYGLNIEPDYSPKYFILEKGKEPENFDKFDYHTWQTKTITFHNDTCQIQITRWRQLLQI